MDVFVLLTHPKEINVGLIRSLAIHVKVGYWGSIESPFYELFERSKETQMKCIVGIGLEGQTALDSGISAIAECKGKIIYTDTQKIIFSTNGDTVSIPLVMYQCPNKNTYMQKKLRLSGVNTLNRDKF
ncbi:hypothetical protein IEQ34_023047 [Dendrobium chrysotoxum]|uniref:Uncharacterized protein n=1 Tax=Dendrobium chrysotoxum TaxID=161865 RepID=A0AAV7FZE8_DENCH|nr:hypothetical protein IEQ34_023047 [Dendrobium chrysotoxum]